MAYCNDCEKEDNCKIKKSGYINCNKFCEKSYKNNDDNSSHFGGFGSKSGGGFGEDLGGGFGGGISGGAGAGREF